MARISEEKRRFFTTGEISESEYNETGGEYPGELSADGETAEGSKNKYVDGHRVITEGKASFRNGRVGPEVSGLNKSIDELLRTQYWIIDILPMQVPKDSPGQYFAVERYFLDRARLFEIKQKHVNTVLKLNCYMSLSLDEETDENPPPERIEDAMHGRHVNIMLGGCMLVSEPDETYMTLYNPDGELLRLIGVISAGEGLYVWQPEQHNK